MDKVQIRITGKQSAKIHEVDLTCDLSFEDSARSDENKRIAEKIFYELQSVIEIFFQEGFLFTDIKTVK